MVKTLKPIRHSVTICTPYCTRHYWLPGFSLQLISCLILFDRFSMEPKVSVLTQKSTICIYFRINGNAMCLKVLSFLIKFWHFKINYGYKIIFILQVFYGGESVSVNPKINNMHPGYKAAIYEFILISDSGIRSKFISNIRGPQKRIACKSDPAELPKSWFSVNDITENSRPVLPF